MPGELQENVWSVCTLYYVDEKNVLIKISTSGHKFSILTAISPVLFFV